MHEEERFFFLIFTSLIILCLVVLVGASNSVWNRRLNKVLKHCLVQPGLIYNLPHLYHFGGSLFLLAFETFSLGKFVLKSLEIPVVSFAIFIWLNFFWVCNCNLTVIFFKIVWSYCSLVFWLLLFLYWQMDLFSLWR